MRRLELIDLRRVAASDLIDSLSHEVQVGPLCVLDGAQRAGSLTPAPVLRAPQVTLADQQQDPNSPLFSAKAFEDLNLYALKRSVTTARRSG